MQDLPIFFLVHKSMRYSMCRMFASLQYCDFATAESAPFINRFSRELIQWTGIHQAVEKSLHAGLGNNHFVLAKVKAGNDIIRQLCEEMQHNVQRWIANNDRKQRLQIGGIVHYHFHNFMAYALLHMNYCETIIADKAKEGSLEKKLKVISRCFAGSFTTNEWIMQNHQLLPAVSKTDTIKWMQFLKEHFLLPPGFL